MICKDKCIESENKLEMPTEIYHATEAALWDIIWF